MKLFLAMQDYDDYDSRPTPLGVFSSIEKAKEACQKDLQSPIHWESDNYGYCYREEPYEHWVPIENTNALRAISALRKVKTNLFEIQEIEIDKIIE